jgi:pyridoxal phosphate enzyme (YggS family)
MVDGFGIFEGVKGKAEIKSGTFDIGVGGLRERFDAVQKRIAEAACLSGRKPEDVKLIAVSKAHPAPVIREAIDAGITALGENKVQEAEGKIEELGRDAAEWHLIGHLQSNKARKAVQLFDVIHSVDSLELAKRLERICIEEGREKLSVLVQVDLAGEATKSGIDVHELHGLADYLNTCERLKFDGLMLLPPFFEDPDEARPYFQHLRKIRDELQQQGAFANRTGELSMGMSNDFVEAIEEGATIVRVGTAIFGEREYTK